MGAVLLVVVLAHLRRRDVAVALRHVVRAPHADEDGALEAEVAVALVADGANQRGDVVGVARDHLQETVLLGLQRLVVDAARVRLAEPELAALRDEAARAGEPEVALLLVLVSRRRAVHDHRGALERLLHGVAHLVAEALELVHALGVGRQLGAARHQVVDLGAVAGQRSAFVEGDLVDAQLVPEVREQPDQGLADRAGAHDVDDFLHRSLARSCRGRRGRVRIASGRAGRVTWGAYPTRPRPTSCPRATPGRGWRTRRAPAAPRRACA